MSNTNDQAARPRRRRRPCGTTAVEFALTFPLALILFFACIEFARMNLIRNSAANAAYEGARRAIIPGGQADQAREACLAVLRLSTVNVATVRVEPATIDDTTPQVTVTAEVPLSSNSWLPPFFLGDRIIIRTCTLTRERGKG